MTERDNFGAQLLRFWFARAFEGESQIQEHIQWNAETKGWVPLAQSVVAALGILATVLGLGLLGWGTTRALSVDLTPGDALLMGVMLAIVLAIAYGATRMMLKASPAAVLAGFTALLFVVVVAAILLAISSESLDWLATLALATAPAITVAGLGLAYRQLMDLFDPYGKTSPVERMMRPYLAQMFIGDQSQAQRLTVPYRINGQLREPVAMSRDDGEPIVRIHRDDLALIEFIREADGRGLSRRRWLQQNQPNVVLPRSGVEVGRDTYDDMMARLTEWGIVSPGGEGKASHWMMHAEDAVELIEREIVAQLVEGERV